MKPRTRASFHSLFTDLLRRSALAKAGRPIHWPITDNAVSQQRECSAFTLLEMLVVMGIIAILMALVVPAFTNLKNASDVTSAANTIKGVLDQARTYAKANNTYTWVGFYEENVSNPVSPNASTPPNGRIIMSIVASKDGTNVATSGTIDSTKLIQVGKLTKVENVHIANDLPSPTGTLPGTTFDSRPALASSTYSIGNTANSTTPFQYPLGGTQYTFLKAVQFSSDGEARVNNSTNALQTAAEIGLRATHGTTVDTVSPNVVAIQFGGVGGDVIIYRK